MTKKKSKKSSKQAPTKVSPKPSTKGLGKGLSALLGDQAAIASMTASPPPMDTKAEAAVPATGVDSLPIEKITPGPWQPRQNFDEGNLEDLTQSVRQHGVVQPLLVRKSGASYQIIAGERRWRAAQKAGLHKVPAVIREATDKTAAELSMIENIQRHDLSAVEEAEGYRSLIDEFDYTQDALAKVVGKSRSHLANMMRLLNLPDDVQADLRSGAVTPGQVRPLIGRADASQLAQMIRKKGLSARQVEALVAKQDRPDSSRPEQSADIRRLEKDLCAQSGFDISLRYDEGSEKGTITIKASSLEQFEAIIAKLQASK